jgi:FKBP-type peptidyl-prolyl cis-trans isomerase
LLGSTYSKGQPVVNKLEQPMFKGSIEEGLTLLSQGDSALFWIPLDSIYKGMPDSLFPKHLPKGTFICYGVKMISVERPEDTEKNQAKAIDAFAEKSGMKLLKTESGLRYAITKEGSGPKPQVGDSVSVHYTGKLASNEMVFDSSVPRGEPFVFPVGQKMVIAGWDEGLQLMNEGSKATLVIPSNLGYGEMGTPGGPIPPNAVLVFDIELLKIIKPKIDLRVKK